MSFIDTFMEIFLAVTNIIHKKRFFVIILVITDEKQFSYNNTRRVYFQFEYLLAGHFSLYSSHSDNCWAEHSNCNISRYILLVVGVVTYTQRTKFHFYETFYLYTWNKVLLFLWNILLINIHFYVLNDWHFFFESATKKSILSYFLFPLQVACHIIHGCLVKISILLENIATYLISFFARF